MEPENKDQSLTRRGFASTAAAAAAGWILTACGPKRLHEMPRAGIRKAIEEMEAKYSAKYGEPVTVSDAPAMPGVQFAYALDLSRCIGCRRCVYACVAENNQSRDPQLQWIRVNSMEKERGIDFSHADPYYQPSEVPQEGHFYVPVSCQQCRNSPCTKVCPTGATWTEPDGIVVIDYDWCIGCRYC
ncbi:MAG: 4Fe-4S dicluster domain-containing protein, partial [Acidobacteriia bacterium]|nr:4Fe-4S dicluster domain-containing protein [Terriglobia bacterium]